jgi:hypothetical protein
MNNWYKESKSKGKKNPCWKGYIMVGMKDLNNRPVPNCVPIKKPKNKKGR